MPQYQGVWTLPVAARLQSTQQWATDPLYRNTTLLLQADNAANGAQNNTFLDSSSNNFTITRNGNTTQGTFTPFSQSPGWWGNYFGGAGSYLSNTSAALVGSTVSTFTAEAWIYMTAAPTSDANNIGSVITLDGQAASTVNYMGFGPISNQRLFLRWFDGAGKTCNGSTVLALNTWYHIAVVVNSNAIAMYVNGLPETLSGTTTLTNRNGTSNEFAIATNNYTSFSGYISNVRVTNTAVYTSAFTPSTIPLTSPSGTLLLTSQSNRFVDTNTQAAAKTLTPAGSSTSVQAFSPFAPQYQYTPSVTGGSGYFDGTGDYLTLSGNTNLALGSGNFTIELWVNITSFTTYGTFATTYNNTPVAGTWFLRLNASTQQWQWQNGSDGGAPNFKAYNSSTNLIAGAWHHLAVVRSSGVVTLYQDGVNVGGGTDVETLVAPTFWIGQTINGYPMNGYISNLRVLKGTAQYTAAFTPPTAPLTAITNTQLLLNFTNAGIYDGTLKNNLETAGNAQVSTSVVKYGTGSMAFDGTGDYLAGPSSPNLAFGTGDFTVEGWFYQTADNTYPTALEIGDHLTANGIIFITRNGGLAVAYANGFIYGPATTLNAWNHIAWVRASGVMKIYVNGVGSAGTSLTNNLSDSRWLFVASTNSITPTNYLYTGYIDDLRVTRGIARYTANFIPPSVALPRQ